MGIRILKMGMLFPMEPRVVRDLPRGLEEILVVEEKRAFIEMSPRTSLRHAGPAAHRRQARRRGPAPRPHRRRSSPDTIGTGHREAHRPQAPVDSVEARIRHIDELKQRPKPLSLARTAYFCSGCPHNRRPCAGSSVAAAGIGCHAMAMGRIGASSA